MWRFLICLCAWNRLLRQDPEHIWIHRASDHQHQQNPYGSFSCVLLPTKPLPKSSTQKLVYQSIPPVTHDSIGTGLLYMLFEHDAWKATLQGTPGWLCSWPTVGWKNCSVVYSDSRNPYKFIRKMAKSSKPLCCLYGFRPSPNPMFW